MRQLLKLPVYIQSGSQRSDLPLPSPHYLRLHAACCRLAHLSGAADHMDKTERNDDSFRFEVFGCDEFSAALAERLYTISPRGISHVQGGM
jgi:hypothetical protein